MSKALDVDESYLMCLDLKYNVDNDDYQSALKRKEELLIHFVRLNKIDQELIVKVVERMDNKNNI